MSQVFTALKGEVLPELRRARLIANVETKNYTNEELLDILKNNEKILDEEALLRVASVAQDNAQKESIYQKAIERFSSSRAMYNLAALYLNEGKVSKAEAGLAELNAADPDVINAKGVVALRKDDFGTAESLFRKAGTPEAKKNLGIVLILTGQYEEAAQVLKDVDGCCHNTVLAYILTDQLDKAMESAHCGDPKVWYLKAIVAARQGKVSEMKTFLERAYKNPSLQARAAKDIEFAAYDL
jgi:Tfp pilus assembly protein PilF